MERMEKDFDKKLEIKRLLIYLFFAFGLTWPVFFLSYFEGIKWDGANQDMQTFIGLGTIMPFVANFITRAITKEGFAMTGDDSLMLGICFKNKKWIYYLFAILIPWIYYEASYLFEILIVPNAFDPLYYQVLGVKKEIVFFFPLIAVSTSVLLSIGALGEEGGWRGYMMPKLIRLIGLPKAIIVGGIIWGLWHAPLTCCGHNFGTEYAGFPYLGILFMCVLCTLIGIMLTFVTVKTQSIWPATFMHAINNATPCILKFFVNEEAVKEYFNGNTLTIWMFLLIPYVIIDAVIILISLKKRKTHREK